MNIFYDNLTVIKANAIANFEIKLTLFSSITAGFPSPADDFLEEEIDILKSLITNPDSTFCARVKGLSMVNSGIYPKDILIIDSSLKAKVGDVVVARVGDGLILKRFMEYKGKYYLASDNPHYPPIEIKPGTDFEIWGVVPHLIHKPYQLKI